MQNATRYLCAAAYLDNLYADRVIKELLDEEQRGVVPSYGFDAEPVIAHCLRGRRLLLTRDLLLIGTVLFTFLLVPVGLLTYLVFALPLVIIGIMTWPQSSWLMRIGYVMVNVAGLGVMLVGAVVAARMQASSAKGLVNTFDIRGPLIVLLLFTIAIAGIAIGYRVAVYQTLSSTLKPGSRAPAPDVGNPRVRERINEIAAAQRGNITLYSGDNPFLGAGKVTAPWARVWSIVVELDRKASGSLSLGTAESPKHVDPVALHAHVRRRIIAMRDEFPPRTDNAPAQVPAEWLPPNERIAGLVVDYHVVARGECVQRRRPLDFGADVPQYEGHPLIDPQRGAPYSHATPDGVAAIIRWPQGGIRCYQRVTIGAQGQAIKDHEDRPVAPAEDQDIVLSAFIYLAVEGRMLYGQFIATVMPPIRRDFRIVDVLPSYSTGRLVWQAVRDVGFQAFGSAITGSARAIVGLLRMLFAALRVSDGPYERVRYTVYDYGAQLSIRELAADRGFHTFMQELDADKYTKLIERRLNEAVLDYLDHECHIDTSQYRQQANMIMNSGVIMTGGSVTGQVAAGTHVVQEQATSKP